MPLKIVLSKNYYDKIMIPKPEIIFAPTTIFPQNFSYPNPMIKYIKMTPATPKLYVNLLKSCKYFYSTTHLVIPVNDFSRRRLWKIISKKNLTKYQLPFKLWLTQSLYLSFSLPEIMKADLFFLKHACRCSFKKVTLWYQTITLKELQFITSNGLQHFDCHHTNVMHTNGTVVLVETIFGTLKAVKHLYFTFSEEIAKQVTEETAKKLIEVIDISKMEKFYLNRIPLIFDFETFKKFTDAQTNIFFSIEAIPNP